jgi:hypothetical protein
VFDESFVALGGEEGVGDGGVVAECLLRMERVDLACDALVAECARRGFTLVRW